MQGNTNATDINRGAETIEHQSSDVQQEVAGQQGGASETYTDPNSHALGEMNTAQSFSPQQIDEQTQGQGKELLELLQEFKQATTGPISSFILQTPTNKGKKVSEVSPVETDTQLPYRRSSRLKKKASKDKLLIKMAQELIAKKCGLLNEEKEMEDMTLQQYLDMYRQPLNAESQQLKSSLK
jgi:hypothetical protein